MSLKPLVALAVLHLTVEPGVDADPVKNTPAVPPKTRIVEPFSKTRVAFMAASEDEQDDLLESGGAALAPKGTPLDPEAAVAEAAPVKKAAATAAKPKPAAKPVAKGDDEKDMV